MKLAFMVPGKPLGVNAMYTPWGKRSILTAEGRVYKQLAEAQARRAWMQSGRVTIDAPVRVAMKLYFRTTSNDIDGPVKHLLDTLEAVGILVNDNRVVKLEVEKRKDVADPRAEIEVETL